MEKNEESIEKQNAAYDAGEASFSEQLTPDSALPLDEVIYEQDGKAPQLGAFFPGLIQPTEEDMELSREDQEYLENLYRRLDNRAWWDFWGWFGSSSSEEDNNGGYPCSYDSRFDE